VARIRVLVSGAKGRMGQVLVRGLGATPDLEVVGETDLGDDLHRAILDRRVEVAVDFTTPEARMTNARAILAAGAHGVIGTTGFTRADLDALDAEARKAERGLVVAPNFCTGVLLLQRFAREAIRHLRRAEITETHHEGKKDAPSGTAVRTAEQLSALGAEAAQTPDHPARGVAVGGVRVHSRRLPGIHARMEVLFCSEHEQLLLSHDALSRDAYVPGVALAVRAVRERIGLTRSLEEILFVEGMA
jgi:4-hydroxy-tetrahydrodipicolinate reductase